MLRPCAVAFGAFCVAAHPALPRQAAAVAYAKAINNDPEKKATYKKKVKKGQTVYHYAMREFLRGTP